MEFIVKINHLKDIYVLNNADAFLLPHQDFSYRFDESFSFTKIKVVKKHCLEKQKKIYILINKIFKDEQLPSLKKFMEKLIEIQVDGFFFTDFSVFMIAKELNVDSKCIFYHETFLRNSYDILTYQELGIPYLFCSKDMHIEDIQHLPENQKNHYGILCFGYIPLYESERKIVSHYLKRHQLDKNFVHSKNLYLKEETREDKYKVLQQKNIASIFDSKVLSYLSSMKELSQHISMFLLDGLFFEVSYLEKVLHLFQKALTEDIDMEALKKLDETIEFTDGFLHKRIGLI